VRLCIAIDHRPDRWIVCARTQGAFFAGISGLNLLEPACSRTPIGGVWNGLYLAPQNAPRAATGGSRGRTTHARMSAECNPTVECLGHSVSSRASALSRADSCRTFCGVPLIGRCRHQGAPARLAFAEFLFR